MSTAKTAKRPRDPNRLAKLMVDIATGEAEEIWSFTCAKQKNVATAKDAPEGAGDT